MPTLITAGDLVAGAQIVGASDGALNIQTGPSGSKVNAVQLASNGAATFLQAPIFPTTPVVTSQTASAIVSGTKVNIATLTNQTFTGIPSWAKRITLMFQNLTKGGTSSPIVQIGSGTYDATSYVAAAFGAPNGNSVTAANSTIGFILEPTATSALVFNGVITINLMEAATFLYAQQGTLIGTSQGYSSAGTHACSGLIDRVKITTLNGTDVFSAGYINIFWE